MILRFSVIYISVEIDYFHVLNDSIRSVLINVRFVEISENRKFPA
jgi:hypothetical protein